MAVLTIASGRPERRAWRRYSRKAGCARKGASGGLYAPFHGRANMMRSSMRSSLRQSLRQHQPPRCRDRSKALNGWNDGGQAGGPRSDCEMNVSGPEGTRPTGHNNIRQVRPAFELGPAWRNAIARLPRMSRGRDKRSAPAKGNTGCRVARPLSRRARPCRDRRAQHATTGRPSRKRNARESHRRARFVGAAMRYHRTSCSEIALRRSPPSRGGYDAAVE